MTQKARQSGEVAAGRAYGAVWVAGLCCAGAVALGVTRPWYSASATVANLPRLEASATGADLMPLTGALGVVLLASFGAVVATRGTLRSAIGVLIAACGIVVLLAAVNASGAQQVLREGLTDRGWSGGSYSTSGEPWRWLVVLGAAGCLAAGAAVARHGARWPTLGQRYDAPPRVADGADPAGSPPPSADADLTTEQLWRALDQGHDPTKRP